MRSLQCGLFSQSVSVFTVKTAVVLNLHSFQSKVIIKGVKTATYLRQSVSVFTVKTAVVLNLHSFQSKVISYKSNFGIQDKPLFVGIGSTHKEQ